MTFPVTTRDTMSHSALSPDRAIPGNSATEQPAIPERKSKAARLLWLGINALGGVIMGLLIYNIDALVRLAIGLLM